MVLVLMTIPAWAADDRNPSWLTGSAETLLYLPPNGYAPTVNISLRQSNAASYALDLKSQVRWRRALVVLDPLVLFGDSGASGKPTYNGVPVAALIHYALGIQITDRLQIRGNHGEWVDIGGQKTHANMWNSLSARFDLRKASPLSNFLEIHVYPPHNEYDPSPAVIFSSRVVARYGMELAMTTPQRRHMPFGFVDPLLLFGDSRPQQSYNWSAKPIGARAIYGAGFSLSNSTQVRVTRGEWTDLGGYRGGRQIWDALSWRYCW